VTLPFTAEQFVDVFAQYNVAVWPAPLVLTALAALCVLAMFTRLRWRGLLVSAVLGVLWLWLALAYHWAFFSRINPLAIAFALVSAAGALLFLWHGVHRRRLRFRWQSRPMDGLGAALVGYALLVYPVLNALSGHRYPGTPTFGLPCPTALFTIGMLAWLEAPYPRSVLVVPILWCLAGVQAAFLLDIAPDLALAPAALIALVLMAKPAVRA
jgi:Family of unknown function (DUF6064)